MDFKSLLQSMDAISETVHKGTYGTEYQPDQPRDDYGHKIPSAKKKEEPKKEVGGQSKADKFAGSTSDIQSMLGNKPSGKVGKVSAKRKLKDWIEVVEDSQLNEDSNERPYVCVHAKKGKCEVKATSSYDAAKKAAAKWGLKGTSGIDSHLADVTHDASTLGEGNEITLAPASASTQVIKQGDKTLGTVNNPQLASTIKQAIGQGQMTLNPDEEQGVAEDRLTEGTVAEFTPEIISVLKKQGYKGPYQLQKLRKWYKELNGYQGLDGTDIIMVQGNDIDYDGWVVPWGNEFLVGAEHQSGPMSINKLMKQGVAEGDGEKWIQKAIKHPGAFTKKAKAAHMGTQAFAKKHAHDSGTLGKQARLAQTLAKMHETKDLPGNQDKLDVAEPKGKLDAKDFAKLRTKKQVKESRIMTVLESINFKELLANADSEIQEMLIELQNDVEMFKETGHTSDLLDSFLKVHLHHNKNKITDEGSIEQHTTHGLDSKPSALVSVPATHEPTSWSVDPINAATDRVIGGAEKAGSFIKGLISPKKNPFESKDMKDKQFESWEQQLNSLLTEGKKQISEGITVSSSTGQQGSPDTVSVTASDADAEKLLAALRQSGIGVFGGNDAPTSPSAYGAPQHEEEPGNGVEIPASPEVIGDGDDMMALIKKMTGIENGSPEEHSDENPEGTATSDYEPEEGGEESSEESSEEDELDEGEVEEGNAFSGAVAKAKADGIQPGEKINVGGKEYPVKEEEHAHDEEDMCNECGMMECECGPEEQVEESFANSDDDKAFQDLQYMLQTLSGGMNGPKRSQSTGNIQKVTMETTLMKDSTSLLTDWQKLSGIK